MALAATDSPRYPNEPVSPAAVPAAFLGTKSSACRPIYITDP